MDERTIFTTALEKTDSAARNAYLDESCGDDAELRNRVDELLMLHNEAGDFLEQSPFEPGRTEALYQDSSTTSEAAKSDDERRTIVENVHPDDDVSLDFLEPSDQQDSLGRLAQYEISEVVGHGGMGIVLKAHDTKPNRVVAVKVLAPELAANPTARKRFLRVAQAAASHDHIVTIYAVEEGDLPYLVMEFIDGQSLQQRIDCQGQMELKEILRIGSQVATGLAAAHEQGLIHRDVKPLNILLENGVERAQITDFGLARAVDDANRRSDRDAAIHVARAGAGTTGRCAVGPVQPGERLVRDVHGPLALPGGDHGGIAAAGLRRHASAHP